MTLTDIGLQERDKFGFKEHRSSSEHMCRKALLPIIINHLFSLSDKAGCLSFCQEPFIFPGQPGNILRVDFLELCCHILAT